MMKTYEEFWMFKPESTLNTYLKENGHVITLYFTPKELITRVTNIIEKTGTSEWGNNEIIFLNKDLQDVFHTESVFKPILYSLLIYHIDLVDAEKVNELRNFNIDTEFYIGSPLELIYNDPTSTFCVHPIFNTLIYANKKKFYAWKELQLSFLKFISNPNPHFMFVSNNMYTINPNSILANMFKFKQFHTAQIFSILQQVTKFLGKDNTVFTLCNQLKFMNLSAKNNVSDLIENVILNNNNYTPFFSSSIFIS